MANDQTLYNLLARACYLLADIRADLIQYENDSAAQGFVCDINDFFIDSVEWLRLLELAEGLPPPSPPPSSVPVAAKSGLDWKAPGTGGGASDTTAETVPPASPSSTPATPSAASAPTSTSPGVSLRHLSVSSRKRIYPDFF